MASRYDRVFDAHVSQDRLSELQENTGYSRHEIVQGHLELYLSFPGIREEAPNVRYSLWGQYLDVMVGRDGDREHFFASMGVHPADWDDWREWRELMGYNR